MSYFKPIFKTVFICFKEWTFQTYFSLKATYWYLTSTLEQQSHAPYYSSWTSVPESRPVACCHLPAIFPLMALQSENMTKTSKHKVRTPSFIKNVNNCTISA